MLDLNNCIALIGLNLLKEDFNVSQAIDYSRNQQLLCIFNPSLATSNNANKLIEDRNRLGWLLIT